MSPDSCRLSTYEGSGRTSLRSEDGVEGPETPVEGTGRGVGTTPHPRGTRRGRDLIGQGRSGQGKTSFPFHNVWE